jgi:hypothetical protein
MGIVYSPRCPDANQSIKKIDIPHLHISNLSIVPVEDQPAENILFNAHSILVSK